MLVDEVTIKVKAGNGGDGKVSFRREKYVQKGGPDGGNGGDGGSLYLQTTSNLSALRKFKNVKEFSAQDGGNGDKQKKAGKKGADLILTIPLGTMASFKGQTVELTKLKERILIDEGGKGGRGNFEFRSATKQAPKETEKGEKRNWFDLHLELQLIADIGLVGKPNAGKSSLLNELSNAKAQVGAFPFTTLEPNLGEMDKLIIADIPGLIKGASRGKGLGIKFLRHIKRTKVVVFCISSEEENPEEALKTLEKELGDYSEELVKKSKLVLLTKSDLVKEKDLKRKLKKLQGKYQVLPVSIYNFDQIQALKRYFKKIPLN